MKNPTPTKRLRVAMKSQLAAVRQVQHLVASERADLEELRRHLSEGYRRLMDELERTETAR
jgi:hypothetical protein